MAVDRQQLVADLPWDIDRLELDPNERASDAALAVLDDCQPDRRTTVQRVRAVARGDQPARAASDVDWTRTLEHADGRLVAVSWSTGGIDHVSFDVESQRFEVGGYSALAELTDDDPHWHEVVSVSTARDMLGSDPSVITRNESDLLPGGER